MIFFIWLSEWACVWCVVTKGTVCNDIWFKLNFLGKFQQFELIVDCERKCCRIIAGKGQIDSDDKTKRCTLSVSVLHIKKNVTTNEDFLSIKRNKRNACRPRNEYSVITPWLMCGANFVLTQVKLCIEFNQCPDHWCRLAVYLSVKVLGLIRVPSVSCDGVSSYIHCHYIGILSRPKHIIVIHSKLLTSCLAHC